MLKSNFSGIKELKQQRSQPFYFSAVTTGGARGAQAPPKNLSLKFFFSKVFVLLSHRFNTNTFCTEDVKKARFSHSRGWKIENFLARRPQPWWGLLSYNTIFEWPPPQYQKRGYGTVLSSIKPLLSFEIRWNLHVVHFSWEWMRSLSKFQKKSICSPLYSDTIFMSYTAYFILKKKRR